MIKKKKKIMVNKYKKVPWLINFLKRNNIKMTIDLDSSILL